MRGYLKDMVCMAMFLQRFMGCRHRHTLWGFVVHLFKSQFLWKK